MSKKKNVRRKKSNNLLKGVAAAGAVVGGGTIFVGNNAVYAAEIGSETTSTQQSENVVSESVSESTTESLLNSTSNQSVSSVKNTVFRSAAEPMVTMVTDTKEESPEGEVFNNDSTNVQENNTIQEEQEGTSNDGEVLQDEETTNENQNENMDPPTEENDLTEQTSQSLSTSTSLMYSEVDSKEALNVKVSESMSLSVSASEASEVDSNSNNPLTSAESNTYEGSLSDAINDFESKYSEIQSSYDSQIAESHEKNVYLKNLYEGIKTQMAEVKKAYDYAHDNRTDKLNSDKYDYYKLVDELAVMYAKYFLFQQENCQIMDVEQTDWEKDRGESNYIKIDYTDANGKRQSAYFDYVITDHNNNKIDGEKKWFHDYEYKDVSIMVLKKSPNYQYGNTNFYFRDDFSTSVKGNRVFYINGQELTMDSSQTSYINEYTYIGDANIK